MMMVPVFITPHWHKLNHKTHYNMTQKVQHQPLKVLTMYTLVECNKVEDPIIFDQVLNLAQVADILNSYRMLDTVGLTGRPPKYVTQEQLERMDLGKCITVFRQGQLAHTYDDIIKPFKKKGSASFYRFEFTDYEGVKHAAHGLAHTQYGETKAYIDRPNFFELAGSEEITTSVETISSLGAPGIIQAFVMDEVELLATVYVRTQHYGGPEEGGWYYHNQGPSHQVTPEEADKFNEELDQYGEGKLLLREFYHGQHTNTHRPHYC